MSRQLPYLPGYNISTRVCKNHPKSQQLVVRQGVCRVDEFSAKVKVKEPTDQTLIPPFGEKDLDPIGGRSHNVDEIVSKKPEWLEYDRKVLRYFAYTKEPVHNNREELERIRKYKIFYYLADKSVQVLENREENSGIPQGSFLRRHRIAKNDVDFLNEHDFLVGAVVGIYKHKFHIVDADDFTRKFMKDTRGTDLEGAIDYPADAHTIRQENERIHEPAGINPIRQYQEESLGAPSRAQQKRTREYLAHGREVLAFECQWNDTALFGEKRSYFRLYYYLADKTVQVFEPHKSHLKNCGRDPFSKMLSRRPLPKQAATSAIPLIGHDDAVCYKPDDFHVGQTVNVYGRDFLITRASDEYTENWYKQNLGRTDEDFRAVDTSENRRQVPVAEPAPWSGFGSEEDSLSSCKALRMKPPRKDIPKMLAMDKKDLRFLAKLSNPVKEDVHRQFILTYYLADDCVSIFEKQGRNSGFIGGKFLEKGKYKNPATGQYFKPQEFVIGEPITVNSHTFQVLEEDEATGKLKYEYNIADEFKRMQVRS